MRKYKDTDNMTEITDIVDLQAYISTDPDYLEPVIIMRIKTNEYDGGFNIGPMLSGAILDSLKENGNEEIINDINNRFKSNKKSE